MTRKVSFSGAVAVVTGAGSGIGRAISVALAREGAVVHGADLNPQRIQATADAAPVVPHVVDCSDMTQMQAFAERVFAQSGRVDLLFNVAGIVVGGPVAELGLGEWRRALDVNLFGVIHGIQAFVPRMVAARRGGHVINVASMAGLVAYPMIAPYCASKFAVVGLSESIAPELAARGIRVTCVCPGMVRTQVYAEAALRLPGTWGARIARAFDRFGADPDTVAQRILRDVKAGRGLCVVAAGFMGPTWFLKRAWPSAWEALLRGFTMRVLRGASRP